MSILRIPTARVFEPLLAPARDKVARGGRGSGKSHFFAGLAVEDALAAPGERAGEGLRLVCIREVQKDLRQSAKRLIETKLVEHCLGEADGFKVFRDVIETPGGVVIFEGMNNFNGDSIKSLEGFDRAWWEEAHGATQRTISLLRPTIRKPGSQLWWSYNRRRKVDPVDVMFSGSELPTGAVIVDANWRDNPWWNGELERERLDTLRLQPDQYAHIWEGDYVQVFAGAYYASQLNAAKAESRIGNVAPDPLMKIRAAWDIGGTGSNADAASIWIYQTVGPQLRVLDYYEASGQPLATHVNWLRSSGYDKAVCVLPHDGVKHDMVYDVTYESALKAAGFTTQVIPNQGRGAAMKRVEQARRVFPNVWFNQLTTQPGLDALGAYHERKDEVRGIGLGPEHDWASHAADAFGLMCIAHEAPSETGWGASPKQRTRVV